MTFAPNKTIKELGIDTSKKFRVMLEGNFEVDDILEFVRDDDDDMPFFRRLSDGCVFCTRLANLSYAERTLRDMQVGDIVVDIEGNEAMVLSVSGKVFLFSMVNDFVKADKWVTFEQAERSEIKLKESTNTKAEECIAYLESVGKITDGKIVK